MTHFGVSSTTVAGARAPMLVTVLTPSEPSVPAVQNPRGDVELADLTTDPTGG